ncbi:hypothetical protein [Rickettsia endosymbiont of Rhinocyllus conicus]|uniref:hypothetical protein n=1 Tax=Rickettsia endosymbiont of Rhinocyllus conicus TaxID=3066252 RepID=UPI003132BD0A
MRLSKEFLDFLIKLPKDHREFKDYFAKEEKNTLQPNKRKHSRNRSIFIRAI